MDRPTRVQYLTSLARAAAARSTCPRAKVGAVIVDHHGVVVATGYNGSMPTSPHCSDRGCVMVGGRCVRAAHAEANAVVASGGRGQVMYSTHQPCAACLKIIAAHRGILVVYYNLSYPDRARDQLLREGCGVMVKKIRRGKG
jgi:dCMP deaminase